MSCEQLGYATLILLLMVLSALLFLIGCTMAMRLIRSVRSFHACVDWIIKTRGGRKEWRVVEQSNAGEPK